MRNIEPLDPKTNLKILAAYLMSGAPNADFKMHIYSTNLDYCTADDKQALEEIVKDSCGTAGCAVGHASFFWPRRVLEVRDVLRTSPSHKMWRLESWHEYGCRIFFGKPAGMISPKEMTAYDWMFGSLWEDVPKNTAARIMWWVDDQHISSTWAQHITTETPWQVLNWFEKTYPSGISCPIPLTEAELR